jgi:sulfur relay (sulfurtransferase) DsrF/TusC family protein
MAAVRNRAAGRPARGGRLRRALTLVGQALAGLLAGGLWLGLASPSLQLLPGVGLADESIEISLQSAMLGIEDGAGRPAGAEALAAADVLGLAYGDVRLLAAAPARTSDPAYGIVRLDDIAAEPVTAPGVQPDEGSAAAVAAPSPPTVAPAVADPPPVVAPGPAPEPQPAATPAVPEPRPVAPARTDPVEVVTTPAPEPKAQSVAFETAPPAEPVVGGSYLVAATASSGLPVKLTVSGSGGACKLTGATVSFRKTGTCVVAAKQYGSERFAAAEARQELEIGRARQTVSFATAPPSPALVGASYAVAASASSGLGVVLSATGACSFRDGVVALERVGTCDVEAVQPGDAAHGPAAERQSFPVAAPPVVAPPAVAPPAVAPPAVRLPQSIAFGSSAPAAAHYGGPSYAVAAGASSGLPVSLSAAGACALAGSTVTFVGVGTCTLTASQAGSALYEPAPPVQQSFGVGRAPQTVAFGSSAPSGAVFGDAPYAVSAAASSGLPVALAASGACSLSGSSVTLVGAGTCTVTADQAGDALHLAAPQVQQTFAVAKAPQSVSFTSTAPSGAVHGGPAYPVSVSATSGLPVSLSASGACSLADSTVSMTGVGTCTIAAAQAGDASHEAAAPAQQSFPVSKAPQAISFTSTPPIVDGSVFFYNVSATATSGLSVGFTLAPSSTGVCLLFGAWVFFYGDGVCTVRADQPGDATWEPAPQVQQSIVVTGHDD